MSEKAKAAVAQFQEQIGQSDGHGEWLLIDQARINLFADATGDHQFIHVDPERAAKQSPYKTTIAHGFLTLSLLPYLTGSIPTRNPKAYEGMFMAVNYGLDKVRFPAPVPVDSKVRAERTLVSAEFKEPNAVQLKQQVTIEIEGGSKPACVAESLTRILYG